MASTKSRHRTKVGKRNQVTIPAAMLRELGVAPGETVELEMMDRRVVVRNAMDAIDQAYGMLKRAGVRALTEGELEDAIREARALRKERATARYERTLDG